MSIETNLERIAAALEKIAEQGGSITVTNTTVETARVGEVEQSTTKAVTTRKPAAKPVEKPVEPETPPVEEPAETQAPADDAKIVHKEEAPPAEPEIDPLDDVPPPATEITQEQVRAALKAYRDIEGSAAMMEVLKNHGAENMSGLKPEKYAEVMAIIQ